MAFDVVGGGGAESSLVHSERVGGGPEDFYLASSLEQTKVSASAAQVRVPHVAVATASSTTQSSRGQLMWVSEPQWEELGRTPVPDLADFSELFQFCVLASFFFLAVSR